MITLSGYWTDLGTAASVDWCEPNYVHSPYVAEWWNTLTGFPMVLLGLFGLWCIRGNDKVEQRYALCFLALAVVGLGSSAFHATILKVAQAADELPMIYGSLIFFYCLVQRKREDKAHAQRWAVGLTIYSLLFTIGYAMLQTYFTLFIWSYAALATLLVLGITRVALSPDATPTHKRLAAGGALFFVGGVFLMWFPEHVFFTCDHPIQGLHLHAAWHLSAGLGTYLGILFLLYDRQHVLGRNPTLKFSRFLRIPYVSLTT